MMSGIFCDLSTLSHDDATELARMVCLLPRACVFVCACVVARADSSLRVRLGTCNISFVLDWLQLLFGGKNAALDHRSRHQCAFGPRGIPPEDLPGNSAG